MLTSRHSTPSTMQCSKSQVPYYLVQHLKVRTLFCQLQCHLPIVFPIRSKKRIWSKEYVDFALLLNNSFTQSDYHYTFRVEKGDGSKPALVLAPNPKQQTVQSIEQWVSAFQVFVAIYSEKAPYNTPALMKYGSVIRELASQGANWRFYDENVRSIRQTGGPLGPNSL